MNLNFNLNLNVVTVIKEDGECPVVDPRDESMQGDCESNCVSDNECPGRSQCCRVGCAKVCLQPRPSPGKQIGKQEIVTLGGLR